jgi:siderophore synthetase component
VSTVTPPPPPPAPSGGPAAPADDPGPGPGAAICAAADVVERVPTSGDRLALEALLRCWIREQQIPAPDADAEGVRLDLAGVAVEVPVEYWSSCGLHRLGRPRGPLGPLGPGAAARLVGEAAGAEGEALREFADRTAESARRIAAHLDARRAVHEHEHEHEFQRTATEHHPSTDAGRSAEPQPASPFLTAEQGLLAGHPLHPAPKSRDAISDEEAARYSPELRGRFALHWFAVEPEQVAHDSELGPSAPDLSTFLSTLTPDGRILIPAHPWQARELLGRREVARRAEAASLEYLGPAGPDWYPTSSLRTVYRPDAQVMLKLSLGLRITNSRRENQRKELLRGVEAHRLLAGPLGDELLTAHPRFRALTDAGYLAAEGVPGLDVSFRHSPFAPTDFVYCTAALTDLGRGGIAPDGLPHELAAHIYSLAVNEGRSAQAAAADWFSRYLRTLILPVFWLDAEHGVALEAHQQNTLIQLDPAGYPGAGWYRDNQGFYYRESAVESLESLSGLTDLGRASETVVPDDVVTERLVYYAGINNLMGMVGALGCAGLGEERDLLGQAADVLRPLRGHRPVDLLLDAPALSCKANLLTRTAGLDELVGALETQSVYVEIANPFAARSGPGAQDSLDLLGGAP